MGTLELLLTVWAGIIFVPEALTPVSPLDCDVHEKMIAGEAKLIVTACVVWPEQMV